ncbi:Hypp5583 [Branchiostoma lanceolatum]|uniref:Hypp5583 protein n=1 Tax=Branchiostoma lanceolatum TaxID=7740 RepID=A0A8J9W3F0_BRALA|nr:Hypp5583 [Branchiostoma lanceolatum]
MPTLITWSDDLCPRVSWGTCSGESTGLLPIAYLQTTRPVRDVWRPRRIDRCAVVSSLRSEASPLHGEPSSKPSSSLSLISPSMDCYWQ